MINHKVILAAVLLAAFNVHADSAYPQLTNINTTGNGSSLQSNANMNSNSAINNTTNNTENNNSANGGVGNGGMANANQNTSFNSPHQAPNVFMGAAMPTAVCQKTYSGFLSMFVFGGIGGAGSVTYDDCMRLEIGRSFRESGRPDLAVKMACRTEYAKELEECKAL